MESLSSALSFTGSIKVSRGLLLFAISAGANMLPAVVKLCCGISYPHLRSMAGIRPQPEFLRCASVLFYLLCVRCPAGLQRAALAVFGQEIAHLQSRGQISHPTWSPLRWTRHKESESESFIFNIQYSSKCLTRKKHSPIK